MLFYSQPMLISSLSSTHTQLWNCQADGWSLLAGKNSLRRSSGLEGSGGYLLVRCGSMFTAWHQVQENVELWRTAHRKGLDMEEFERFEDKHQINLNLMYDATEKETLAKKVSVAWQANH